MKTKYLYAGLGVITSLYVIYKLQFIIILILLSGFISLLLTPIKYKLKKIRIKKVRLSNLLCTVIVYIMFYSIIFLIISLVFPIVLEEIKLIGLKLEDKNYLIYTKKLFYNLKKNFLIALILEGVEFDNFVSYIKGFFSVITFSDVLSGLLNTITKVFISVFSVMFISFFFLKEDNLFKTSIVSLTPNKYSTRISYVYEKIKITIGNYLIGVFFQYIFFSVILFIILEFFDIKYSIILAFIGGILNIIPYLGVIMVQTLSVFLIISTSSIDTLNDNTILYNILFNAVLIATVQIIDAFLIQPTIFSKFVNAHPLEIFLIIISSGYLFGFLGIVLAIPGYSALRIIAKYFFHNYELIKKITKNI